MTPATVYLLHRLEEVFAPEQLRVVQPTGVRRAPDLKQDYDPESRSLHRVQGVNVRVSSRDYFFSSEWVEKKQFDLIEQQLEKVRALRSD